MTRYNIYTDTGRLVLEDVDDETALEWIMKGYIRHECGIYFCYIAKEIR